MTRTLFDCGEPLIPIVFCSNRRANCKKRSVSRTHLAIDENEQIAGFYSLSTTQIHRDDSPEHLKQFSAYQPIPAALIGRLAINEAHQGQGRALSIGTCASNH